MTEQSHDGLIRLRLRDHVVSAYATSEGWPIVETDESFQLLAGVSYGTRAILVGPRQLIELNMERIARAVYSGESPPPPPASDGFFARSSSHSPNSPTYRPSWSIVLWDCHFRPVYLSSRAKITR